MFHISLEVGAKRRRSNLACLPNVDKFMTTCKSKGLSPPKPKSLEREEENVDVFSCNRSSHRQKLDIMDDIAPRQWKTMTRCETLLLLGEQFVMIL